MSVVVVPYSEAWPRLFDEEAARLHEALSPWLAGSVQHIGSTAVPGLAAKPVLDMLGPVGDLDDARGAVPVLADLGYQHADHRPHEALWFFRNGPQGVRTHQLHLTRTDSSLWLERLTFRDALRADRQLVTAYGDLKRALAAEEVDLRGYTDGKQDFVADVLRQAGVELARRGSPSERPGQSSYGRNPC